MMIHHIPWSAIWETTQIAALPLVLAITLHEAAHAFAARLFGDFTASRMGRLTLNPLKHIDWIGTILVPGLLLAIGGMLFGWAKPVPVDEQRLQPKRFGMAMVALAGPASNVLMALGWAWCQRWSMAHPTESFASIVYAMGAFGFRVNLVLAVLNMLPIPPLDGSRIVSSILPRTLARIYGELEQVGLLILFALMSMGLLQPIMQPAMTYLSDILAW